MDNTKLVFNFCLIKVNMYLNTPRWKAYNHVWTLWVQRLTWALEKQFRTLTYRDKQAGTLLGSVLMFHSSYLPLRSFAVLHVWHLT